MGAIQNIRVLLGVTGGIAAFKSVYLLRLLTKAGARVRVVMTEAAARFVGATTFEALSDDKVYDDLFQRSGEGGESHIALTEWADIIVIAPATADVVAKAAHGIASDLLGCVLLAARSPVIMAPAMHTAMYQHPATQANLQLLASRGVHLVAPVEGDLASGFGPGRMAEPEVIVDAIERVLTPHDLEGVRVLVTAGPTREPIDPVRHITNRSSGKMGYALARVARRRGADVVLVSGPVALDAPAGVVVERVETAREMHDAVHARYAESDLIIMAAAVADYAPADVSSSKIKKTDAPMTLALEPTPDILASLGRRRAEQGGGGPLLVGFAMETEDLEARARDKLERKGCDLIVANDISAPGVGFGVDTNRVTLIAPDGSMTRLPLMSKDDVASAILDRVASGLTARQGEA